MTSDKINFIKLSPNCNSRLVFDKPGKNVVFFHNLSADLVFEIKASGVHIAIFGLYIGQQEKKFQISTVQHHIAPNSSSNLLIKGVFRDQSHFEYEGLIRIEKSAQKSHAYQKNQNLILSPYVFVDSQPKLEILANDVFCTHGSTTGRLNKDQLFYVGSRGLDKKTSEKLLTAGFIQELYDQIRQFHPAFVYSTSII